ncbi:MAG: sigma-70 family RNA polymerase sigma factor [Lachnospiraceae bacterium]|nr:sigma-70 family RNA polymerase sigma factor [Lachnospiraceae bacterium]
MSYKNITIKELKNLLKENEAPKIDSKRKITRKLLADENYSILFQTPVNDNTLTVYRNGYILYEHQKYYTIFTLDALKIEYKFVDGTHFTVPESEYCDNAILALAMIGEMRLARNSYARSVKPVEEEIKFEQYNINLSVPDIADDIIKKYEKECTYKKLKEAYKKLTKKQQEVLWLYYFNNYTQEKTASLLGIGRTSVQSCINNAIGRLKKLL